MSIEVSGNIPDFGFSFGFPDFITAGRLGRGIVDLFKAKCQDATNFWRRKGGQPVNNFLPR